MIMIADAVTTTIMTTTSTAMAAVVDTIIPTITTIMTMTIMSMVPTVVVDTSTDQ
jgi:hypothetical protein